MTKSEIEIKIGKLKKAIDSPLTQDKFKEPMKKQLGDLEQQLKDYKEPTPEKSEPKNIPVKKTEKVKIPKKVVEKKVEKVSKPVKKASAKKESTEKKSSKSKGEPEVSCDELMDAYNKRKKSHDKAAKQYATTSVSEKIGNNLASAVSKAISNIDNDDIKKSPKKYIAKFELIEKETKAFISKLKPILGEDFDKEDILSPLEEVITKHIENLKKKYK